ncbi:MAG: RNA methyltransferase [Deltaproteobacteria bacterium]|nr:MAG: RNA methyltransferase [Deltaproteobacteria bacterium]
MDIYIALVHHPVLNRAGDIVTTAVTNIDIHDLARAARTYGVSGYFLVTPIEQQRAMVSRIVAHWQGGGGESLHPLRAEALSLVRVVSSLAEAERALTGPDGRPPVLVGTSARRHQTTVGYSAMRERLTTEEGAALLLFGTGWGLTGETLTRCSVVLPPVEAIAGRAGYNHLSVRSAVAIILDRLLGAHEAEPGS